MPQLAQLRRIYTNILFSTEKYLKQTSKLRVDMSYYRISEMDENKLINNIEHLSNIIKPTNNYYSKTK